MGKIKSEFLKESFDLVDLDLWCRYRGEHLNVASIDFVNRVIEILPSSELEGGNTIDVPFEDCEGFYKKVLLK